MKDVPLLTEEEYLLALRKRIDELKARTDLPCYRYADKQQAKVIAYFLDRGIQIGEASFRIRDLPVPLDVLMRVLCEDLIRLVWVSQSEANAAEYAKSPVSELARAARLNLEKGHARIVDRKTGQDATAKVLPHLGEYVSKGKSIEQTATECGLEKLYSIVFRFGSPAVHGNAFELYQSSDEALTTLPAVNALLRAEARVADNYPNRTTGPEEILRILGFVGIGNN